MRLPLVAGGLALVGMALGHPWVEDRAGAVLSAGALRAVLVVILLVCVADHLGRAWAARRCHPVGEVEGGAGEDDGTCDLVAVVSHELRTPLTSMLGLMSTVQRGVGRLPPDRLAEFAAMACEQGWRMDRMIDDLLLRGPGDADLRPERRDAVATVQDAVAALATEGHQLRLALPGTPVSRYLDHEVLVRVVTNLVGNALKYTPAGSRITVAVRPLGTGIELAVTDDGPGMSPEDRARAFEKYWRGDSGASRGLGLGLYLVRVLAAAHGGGVVLDEAPGGGCRFTVRFEELNTDAPAPAFSR